MTHPAHRHLTCGDGDEVDVSCLSLSIEKSFQVASWNDNPRSIRQALFVYEGIRQNFNKTSFVLRTVAYIKQEKG